MQKIRLSQTDDREAWLEERRQRITGTKFASVRPLKVKRNGTTTPSGFWDLLAEYIAVAPTGQKPMDRGHDLENVAIGEAAAKLKIPACKVNTDPGFWISDDDNSIADSPDGAENAEKVTFAFEVKCLNSGKHLMYTLYDNIAKHAGDEDYMSKLPEWLVEALPPMSNEYDPLLSVPPEYQNQALQYFVVNKELQTLYFVLYDDRMSIDDYVCHIITINRKDVDDRASKQYEVCKTQLGKIRELLKLIVKGGIK